MKKPLPGLVVAIVLALLGLWFFLDRSPGPSEAERVRPPMEADGDPGPVALPVPGGQDAREVRSAGADPAGRGTSDPQASKGSVRGRFITESNAPVPGVEIVRYKGDQRPLATSGEDGRFRFEVEDFTQSGRLGLYLRGRKDPFVPCRLDIVALAGEEIDLGDLLMRAGGSVSGHVVDSSGIAIEDANVSCTDADLFDRDLGLRLGPASVIAETRSRAGGEFLLEGALPGKVRMWAGKKGLRFSFSELVEVRAGEETPGVVLVLVPRTSADDFEIQVLKPDGSPCAGAIIDFNWNCEATGNGGATGYLADEKGHLTLVARPSACKYEFLASDPQGQFGPASVKDVVPGSGPVVLQLVDRVPIRLHVVDQGGTAVERFHVRITEPQATHKDAGARILEDHHPGGLIELVAPDVPFLVIIDADGFDLAEFGPFHPPFLPSEVEARLRSLAAIAGMVTGGGEPIEGAKVELRRAVSQLLRMEVNGFPTRCDFSATSKCDSDAEGAFRLSLRRAGPYFVRAEKEGWALAELGPLTLDPAIGARDLRLELTAGGSIQGKLLLPAGQAPIGSVIGISRGDGIIHTQRVDSEGAFDFEHLTPGRWLVKRLDGPLPMGGMGVGMEKTEEPVEIPWNCHVFEGSIARFDLDLSVEQRVVLVGSLTLAGKPATGWLVSLETEDSHESTSTAEILQGSFALFGSKPGGYLLKARSKTVGLFALSLVDRCELFLGEQAWDCDLPAFGRVEGFRPNGSGPIYWLQWTGPGDLEVSMEFPIDDQGRFTLSHVPSGACKLGVWTEAGRRELAACEVRPNETTTVHLP